MPFSPVSGSFTASATGDSLKALSFSLGTDECKLIWLSNGDPSATVTVTELPQAGQVLTRIVTNPVTPAGFAGEVFYHNPVSSSITVTVGDTIGNLIIFKNAHLGQGCTLGYWKQSQHFDSWPAVYTPSTSFSSVANAFPGKTFLQVLELGGGGLNALGRHTVCGTPQLSCLRGGLPDDHYGGDRGVQRRLRLRRLRETEEHLRHLQQLRLPAELIRPFHGSGPRSRSGGRCTCTSGDG